MNIYADYRDQVLYMHLNGEIDEHNAVAARLQADSLVDEHAQSERAVIDLKEVSFMDSTGVDFLIGIYIRCRRYGISVYMANPPLNADANKILQMSGIYTLIPKIK